MSDSVASWNTAQQASLSFTVSQSCAQTQCWWCHPTISFATPFFSCFQSFPASGALPMSQFFASDGQSIGIDFRISSFNKYSGLISFRIDWFDFLAAQGTLKSLLQHHSSKASILRLVNKAEVDVVAGIPLLYLWSKECWKFGIWFFCLF